MTLVKVRNELFERVLKIECSLHLGNEIDPDEFADVALKEMWDGEKYTDDFGEAWHFEILDRYTWHGRNRIVRLLPEIEQPERNKLCPVYIDEATHGGLKWASKRHGVSMSEFVRQILIERLDYEFRYR